MSGLQIRNPFYDDEQRKFVLFFCLSVLLLPLALSIFGYDRRSLLNRPSDNESPTAYVYQSLFKDKSDVDIAMIGPCLVWWHIDASALVNGLESDLKRPIRIVVLGANEYSLDLIYLVAKDLLSQRKIKYLLMADPNPQDLKQLPHPDISRWLANLSDISDLATADEPKLTLQYYADLVLRGAWNGVHFLNRQNQVVPTEIELLAMGAKYQNKNQSAVTPIKAQLYTNAEFSRIYKTNTEQNKKYKLWHIFLKKIDALLLKNSVKLIVIRSPYKANFGEAQKFQTQLNWSDLKSFSFFVDADFEATKKQFDSADFEQLFSAEHLSAKGALYFSEILRAPLGNIL